MSDIEKKPIKTKGGPRPNSGRKKGSPNKVTAEIREIAQQYGQTAINTLVSLMQNASSDSTRVMAAKEILDRAYGKSTQLLEHSGDFNVTVINSVPLSQYERTSGK